MVAGGFNRCEGRAQVFGCLFPATSPARDVREVAQDLGGSIGVVHLGEIIEGAPAIVGSGVVVSQSVVEGSCVGLHKGLASPIADQTKYFDGVCERVKCPGDSTAVPQGIAEVHRVDTFAVPIADLAADLDCPLVVTERLLGLSPLHGDDAEGAEGFGLTPPIIRGHK